MHFKKEKKKSKLSHPMYSEVEQQQFDRFPSKLLLYSYADECLEKKSVRKREGGTETDGWEIPLGYSPSYAFSGSVRLSPGSLGGASGKEPACQCKRWKRRSFIPGWGRPPGGGNGTPLQYSCLENPMDREACWDTAHGVAKSRTRLSDWTELNESFYCSVFSPSIWHWQPLLFFPIWWSVFWIWESLCAFKLCLYSSTPPPTLVPGAKKDCCFQ